MLIHSSKVRRAENEERIEEAKKAKNRVIYKIRENPSWKSLRGSKGIILK